MPTSSTASQSNAAVTPAARRASIPQKLEASRSSVSLTGSPKYKNVSSRVGSMDNIHHTPQGGAKKIFSEKKTYNVAARVGSLENLTHTPAGGKVKIHSEKLDYNSRVSSKVGSLDNLKHQPAGGNVKVTSRSHLRIRTVLPKSVIKIPSEKLHFKDKVSAKVGSKDNLHSLSPTKPVKSEKMSERMAHTISAYKSNVKAARPA